MLSAAVEIADVDCTSAVETAAVEEMAVSDAVEAAATAVL